MLQGVSVTKSSPLNALPTFQVGECRVQLMFYDITELPLLSLANSLGPRMILSPSGIKVEKR